MLFVDVGVCYMCCFFFFKQKAAYDMRISDWSSDVCSSDLYDKGATIGIDHCMAFASHGLLACVVTTRSACFGGLHALAVDDCRGWCWFSPCPDAIDPNEMMIEAFEYPIVAQGAEPLVYRAPWRKTVGQKPPGTS